MAKFLLPSVMFGGIVKKCSRLLSNGMKEYFCCDNHEEVNGTCIECKNGFLSERGEPCVPCPDETYGRKCDGECACKINQRCDNVFGCMNTAIITQFPEYNSKKNVSQHATFTDGYFLNEVTRSDYQDTIFGLLKREIVVYSICTGGFAVLIFLSMLLLRQYKRTSLKAKARHGTTEINFQEQNVPDPSARSSETVDSIYETIDESNILDINISTDLQVMYDESGNPSGIDDEHELHAGSNNDSYETPLSDTNVHTNSTAVNNPSTSSSFSSVSGGSGYLNPYQPIVFDVDIHKYSSTCGVKERVDTIGYEADKSVPDKLNPYQSFFSITNNQNYNSIIIQDGMETSVHIIGEKGEIFDQSTVSSNCDSKTSSTNKSKASSEFHRSETETVNLKNVD